MCSGSLARFLFIPSVRFKSTGRPSALASLLGPSIAQDEMTLVDILNSARLNPHQRRRSQPSLLLFYVSSHLLLYPAFVTLSCLWRPLFYFLWGPVWKMEIVFPIISQLWLTILSVFFFCQQRGSDELSMYNSPNSGMSSISGEFVPTTPEGGGWTEFACSHLIGSDRRHWKEGLIGVWKVWNRLRELNRSLVGAI